MESDGASTLQDRAEQIADAVSEGFNVNEAIPPRDWSDSYSKARSWALELLQVHAESVKVHSASRGVRELAAVLTKHRKAVKGALQAIQEMDDEVVAAITASHTQESDYLLPAVYFPHRDRKDGVALQRSAIIALNELDQGLGQAIEKFRADPSRADIPARELRRGLAHLARACGWLPNDPDKLRRKLADLNRLAGLRSPNPDDNQTAFENGYGRGWLKEMFR